MHTTPTAARRLSLLPVEDRRRQDSPVVRRYRLGRVLDDLGAALAAPAAQAPAAGVRAP